MAFTQYLKFNGTVLPLPDSYDLNLADVEADSGEETGATAFDLTPICVYSVCDDDGVMDNASETFGMLYFAEITSFGELPPLEIERIELFNILPTNWTYPEIQPKLLQKASEIHFVK
ncbi:MAG: hypothetical protein RR621_10145 [Lachnospiraceae bacterium]